MGATGIAQGGHESAVRKGTWVGVKCSVEECGKPAKAKGMCMSHYNKSRWAEGYRSPSGNQLSRRAVRLKQRYGLTVDEYYQILDEQDGRCAICRGLSEEVARPKHWTEVFCVDHDHGTEVVRGLLCNDCNLVVARGHTPERLRIAAEYLERWN